MTSLRTCSHDLHPIVWCGTRALFEVRHECDLIRWRRCRIWLLTTDNRSAVTAEAEVTMRADISACSFDEAATRRMQLRHDENGSALFVEGAKVRRQTFRQRLPGTTWKDRTAHGAVAAPPFAHCSGRDGASSLVAAGRGSTTPHAARDH